MKRREFRLGIGILLICYIITLIVFLVIAPHVPFLAFLLFALFSSVAWTQDLVVSTQPIYLIAQEVTKGIEKPTLLLADQSGHDVSLTPMHRKIIQDAGLVVWLGRA